MAQTWPAARLTATATGELDLARTHLRGLVTAASALVRATGHDPDLADCDDAGCTLAGHDHGVELCALAHRLALLAPETEPTAGVAADGDLEAPGDPDAALAAFRGALVDSLDAVRTCRSVWHAQGQCWFTQAVGVDGCGEVLRAAHRAG